MAKSEKLTVKELKEKLLADKKNAVLRMSEEELKKCDKFCEGYKAFLDIAKTEREASAEIVKMAKARGVQCEEQVQARRQGFLPQPREVRYPGCYRQGVH